MRSIGKSLSLKVSRKTAIFSLYDGRRSRRAPAKGIALQQDEKVAKLVQWFARAALRHAEAMESMDQELAAAEVADLNRYFSALEREGGVEKLLDLLQDADPAVAGMVAVYGIKLAPKRCLAALAVVARQPGLIGFRAQAALERWEKGDWE